MDFSWTGVVLWELVRAILENPGISLPIITFILSIVPGPFRKIAEYILNFLAKKGAEAAAERLLIERQRQQVEISTATELAEVMVLAAEQRYKPSQELLDAAEQARRNQAAHDMVLDELQTQLEMDAVRSKQFLEAAVYTQIKQPRMSSHLEEAIARAEAAKPAKQPQQ